jgi:hypothetical protein
MANATVRNLGQLMGLYRTPGDKEIALFLGAGVNSGSWATKHPACASWPELLKVLGKCFRREGCLDEKGLQAAGNNWINAASKLLDGLDRVKMVRAIDHIIYAGMFRDATSRTQTPRKHKVMKWTVLKQMPTLCATVCFSAAIGPHPAKARSMRRNPKIARVLTTNYDFFFGAAWPRYTSMRSSWWPETRTSTGTRLESARPIVYLHGYLPYSGVREVDVVITQDDYDLAYSRSGGADEGFARHQLTHAIDRYHLIFIGFSFSDDYVCKALRRSTTQNKNFAFLHESESATIRAAEDAGVVPVVLKSWAQLPNTLRDVYCTGLTQCELERTERTGAEYWATLQSGLEPRARKSTR